MTQSKLFSIVLTTTSSEEQAETLARKLLGNKLAACIQVQKIKSFYLWKGEQCADPECLLFIKTRAELYPQLEKFIASNHPYETPEIIQLPIQAGSSKYLSWINEVTDGTEDNAS